VTFDSSGCAVSGDPVTLHGGISNIGDNIWGINTVLGENQTIHVDSGTLTVNATIFGDHDLTKSGPGTLIIQDCEFTGNLTVAAGTLEVQSLTHSPQVTVHGILIAGSIVADTLTIGGPAATTVPEPASLVLLAWIIPCWGGWFYLRCRARQSAASKATNG
jgi:autotransporter-associated beta strand protein